MNSLLNPSELTTETHTTDDFSRYFTMFTGKADAIHVNTSGAPLPTISYKPVMPLSNFDLCDCHKDFKYYSESTIKAE